MKNIIKAMVYLLGGFLGVMVSGLGIFYMYFSATFLPVYVKDTYVIGNQVLRYILYALLVVLVILAGRLACYGMNYLIKRFHKIKRRK